ncbi:MAG: PKD domain-containing protein [Candidatus Bathyarchaeota archaeon]|nr:PKD domain-containing protein [Candidatus Bathyarchaeota archaeon]
MRFSYLLLASFLATVIMLSLASPSACYLPEDVNHDGRVDMDDIMAVKEAYGYQSGNKYWNPNVDVVADGKIDIFDVVKIIAKFGAHMPVASFTESAHTAPVGIPIEFDPSESYDYNGTILLYEWDFDGDGVYDKSTTFPDVVSFVYLIPREYNVTLRVTDDDGLTDTAMDTKMITSTGVIPEVPLGTIVALAAMMVALMAYAMPRWRRKRQGVNP